MKGMSIVIAASSALCLMACSQSETSGQATTAAEPTNVTEQNTPAITAQQQPDVRDQMMDKSGEAMEQTDQAAFEAGERMNEQSEDAQERIDNMNERMNEGTNQE